MITKTLLDAKEALEELNLKKILKAYDDPFIFEDIPNGFRLSDREHLSQYFSSLFSMPGVAFSDIRIFDGGQFAALEWTWSGINQGSGKGFSIRGASVIEIRNQKIARESIYYDPRETESSTA